MVEVRAHAFILTVGHSGVAQPEQAWGWSFIDQAARGENTVWSYLDGLLRLVAYPAAFAYFASLIAVWATPGRRPPPLAELIVAFGFIIAGGAAVVHSVAWTHKRPWLSVVTPSLTLDWRRLAIGAGVQAALALPLLALALLVTGLPWRSNAAWSVVATALLLIPFQAASEEIIFRGYLTQALGRVFCSRTKIVVGVGILFAALHWNQYGLLTMPYIFLVSVILSLVSLRDDRLELTIGAHTAWNWIGVNQIPLLSGHAIQMTWWYFLPLLVQGALLYGLSRFFVRRFCNKPHKAGA